MFPRKSLDVRKAVADLKRSISEELASYSNREGKRGVIVVWDVAFDWLAGERDTQPESLC